MAETVTRTLPAQFIEDLGRDYGTQIAALTSLPVDTTKFAPTVAAQDPLQTAAYQQATDPTTGLGSFQPFLTKAGAAADATTALTGTGAGTGAGSIASYMSPYQQQVIDTTMQDFDQQAQMRQNQLAAQTLGIPGAFGGGREGVQRAEYDASSDRNRAAVQSNLLQQDARGLASGLGSFQPFLTKATTAADAMTSLTGTGAGTGAGSIASYQSPYQQQVIDATLTEFDRQAQIRANQTAAQTLGIPGAFGGGREGVQRAEYQASSDRNRAALQAGLLQEGFQNAAARRQQDLANQQAISTQQRGLGAATQDFTRAQISGLGTLGAAQQAQQQAVIDASRQAAQMAVDDPRRRLGLLGTGITSITPGAGGVTLQPEQMPAAASPLSQALGFGLMGADIYGRIFRPTGS